MNLRAAILDYPIRTLEYSPSAGLMLGDVIKHKQMGFSRTHPDFVVMDKHDMIGTHFLVYDCSDTYHPKLVLAIRNTYEARARKHGLKLPIEDYIHLGGPRAEELLQETRNRVGVLVDCNAWFVDPQFSKKNSGLNLSELGFLLVTMFIKRLGQSHLVGATNERYNASRWIRVFGEFPEGLHYTHPFLGDPHCICLVEPFKHDWMLKAAEQFAPILHGAQEILGLPDEVKTLTEVVNNLKQSVSAAA